jgi:CBS domain-containing protein
MQTIADVMTRNVRTIAPQETVQRAAELMDELNVGSLPVCDGERLVGMITDRDITVRATSVGESPNDARVEEVMSEQVRWCFDDQPVDEVMQQMSDIQIRRVPVVHHDTLKLVGIVSLGDVATKHSAEVDRTLENISTPSEPDRRH